MKLHLERSKVFGNEVEVSPVIEDGVAETLKWAAQNSVLAELPDGVLCVLSFDELVLL